MTATQTEPATVPAADLRGEIKRFEGEYIQTLNAIHAARPDNTADYWRWNGHGEKLRQVVNHLYDLLGETPPLMGSRAWRQANGEYSAEYIDSLRRERSSEAERVRTGAELDIHTIQARADAAQPGPWSWRGNVDYGDPRLCTSNGIWGDEEKPRTGSIDILGLVSHEVTRDEAIRRGVGDLDFLLYPVVAEEPADTYDERLAEAVDEVREAAIAEYLVDPHGTPRTERRLGFVEDGRAAVAADRVVYEVCADATDRSDPRVYRADIVDIRNPNAQFIAAARQDVDDLLAEVRRLRAENERLTEELADA